MFDSGKNYKLIAGGQTISKSIVRCSSCNSIIEENDGSIDISIWLDYLGKLGFSPFLWNSGLYTILRQDVVDVWKKAEITGYETGKVSIYGWYNQKNKSLPPEIPAYYHINPTSRVTLSEPKTLNNPCSICGFQEYDFPKLKNHLQNGLQVDLQSWNSSDINYVDRYKFVICSEKVVRATLEAKLGKYLPFVQMEKYCTWEEFNIQKWKPKDYDKYYEGFLIRKIEDLEKK